MRQLNLPAIELGSRRWNRTISLSVISRLLARRALRQWVPAGDLNSPLSLTKAADRPLSLPGTTYGADGDARNPNLSLTKRAFFLLKATGRIPRTYGAEYGSSTRLTGLEDQHLSDRPTPQRHTYPVVKHLTTQLVGTAGFEPASPCFGSK